MMTVNAQGRLQFDGTQGLICEKEKVRSQWERLRLRDIAPVAHNEFTMLMRFLSWARKVDVLPDLVRGAK